MSAGTSPIGEVFRLAGIIPDVGLAGEQIDHAGEGGFLADRQHHDQRLGTEDGFHLLDDAVEVRADAVHLVDVDDAGNARIIGVAPVGFGLGFHTAGGAEHADAAVEHLERAIDLDGEVHVAGGVDDVELVAFPEAGGGGGLDGDAALGFLFHEVHGGGTVVDLADFVDLAGEFENALGGRGLARIDVGENADVAVFGEVLHACGVLLSCGRRVRAGGAFLVGESGLAILESRILAQNPGFPGNSPGSGLLWTPGAAQGPIHTRPIRGSSGIGSFEIFVSSRCGGV